MPVLHGEREILISSYNTIISALEHRNGVNYVSLDQLYREADSFSHKLKFIVRKVVFFLTGTPMLTEIVLLNINS